MKKLIILLILLIAVGTAACVIWTKHPDWQRELPTTYETTNDDNIGEEIPEEMPEETDFSVSFSKHKSFYSEDIEVELSCPDSEAAIYYTINGNDPDEKAKLYNEPITLRARSSVIATTIKAVAVNGEKRSDTAVHSYVVGKDVEERFSDDTLIFVLSSDEYNLYDYYNGIAVEGYLRDEYMKNEYTGGEVNPGAPANYNIRGRESERDIYVEVFDNSGTQLISQPAGTRVVGGYSRANDQKSFRLIARKVYSEGKGKFEYPFFGDDRDAYGNIITGYDRITLRDGANDREFAGVRDELSMTLAADAGFTDVQSVRPAAVFLNSRYYGFAWLHEAYSDDYLEMMYGGNKDNFRIIGAKELEMESDDPADEQALADWQHVIELAEKDLTQNLNFARFCELVDIDDLMLYYAMQIYIDNKDWPGNNFKAWKYYASDDETITSPYLDGKWRFLLFDAEFAWGLYGNGYKDNTLRAVISGKHMQGASHILRGLLARKDMQEKFANTVCELVGGAFSPENVKQELQLLLEKSDPEQIDHALVGGKISEWANTRSFAESRSQIADFAEKRPGTIMNHMKTYFGYSGETYNVTLHSPSAATVKIGSQKVNGRTLAVDYFTENKVEVSASYFDGAAFDHWEINGRTVDDPELILDSSMADSDGKIDISLMIRTVEKDGDVCISEVYTAGEGDWIELYNPKSEAVKLKGWHLSDKRTKPDKYTIPDIEIPAYSTVMIVCKDNSETSALMKHQTNFSLRAGEKLYFSDPDLNIVTVIPIIEMKADQSLSLGIDGLYHVGVVTEGVHYDG